MAFLNNALSSCWHCVAKKCSEKIEFLLNRIQYKTYNIIFTYNMRHEVLLTLEWKMLEINSFCNQNKITLDSNFWKLFLVFEKGSTISLHFLWNVLVNKSIIWGGLKRKSVQYKVRYSLLLNFFWSIWNWVFNKCFIAYKYATNIKARFACGNEHYFDNQYVKKNISFLKLFGFALPFPFQRWLLYC